MSWGSSKLAAELGLPGHQGPVAVIGAGVMGLTTARLVQEAGFPVTIYAKALPPDTTSNIAGGQFHPFGHFQRERGHARMARPVRSPRWIIAGAASRSWSATITGYAGCPPMRKATERQLLARPFRPRNRVLTPGRASLPGRAARARYDTLYVETGRFLRQLTARRADRRRRGSRVRNLRHAGRDRGAARAARLQLHRPRRPRAVRRQGDGAGPRPARHPAAAARGPLRLHRRGRLHVPARRRHRARRHVRARRSGRPRPSPRRSPASSPRTSACSAASAAPPDGRACS